MGMFRNSERTTDELKPGDLLEIFRSSSQHWAIYVGDGKVVHLAMERKLDGTPNTLAVLSDRAYVKKDWLEDVVRKDGYRVNNKHDETHPPLPLAKILWQVEDLVGREVPYAWSGQNCERFVMELRYGADMNEQVGKAAVTKLKCSFILNGYPGEHVLPARGASSARIPSSK
uniref:LRAT domain-containing protein n=1 Tax=Salvator merianae TaxID=96440 RepID=A0A8D0BUD3_SALMN